MEYLDYIDHISEISLRIILYLLFSWIHGHTPFIRYIDEDELWMYRYPAIPSIVPKYILFLIIILGPIPMFLFEYFLNRRIEDIVQGMYSLSLIYALNGVLTVTLKLLVGRPRPNFFMRCFPDGYGTDINSCTGDFKSYMDGRKSFPSAHSTFIFSGMFFMTIRLFYLLKIREPGRGKGFKCLLCSLPLIVAVLVGVSRTCDYSHHYSDVIAGALMGTFIAYNIYYIYYPKLYGPNYMIETK